MNKRKHFFAICFALIGITILLVGAFIKIRTYYGFSSVLIGIGAGIFGTALGNIIRLRMEAKNPEIGRNLEIEKNDERNTAIRDKAGAMVNRISLQVLSVLVLIFALLRVELAIILCILGIIVLQGILIIFFQNYYSKRM